MENQKLTFKNNMKELRAGAKALGIEKYSTMKKVDLCIAMDIKVPKRKLEPNMPKKPRSAFIYFSNEKRETVKKDLTKKNPNMNGKEIFRLVAKELGARWKKVSENDKKKYTKMAEDDKKRYEKEITEYNNKNNKQEAKVPVKEKKAPVKKVEKSPAKKVEKPPVIEESESESEYSTSTASPIVENPKQKKKPTNFKEYAQNRKKSQKEEAEKFVQKQGTLETSEEEEDGSDEE